MDKGRLVFDSEDPETIAYDTKALVLVVAEALNGPHCRQELELSEDERASFAHGQTILLNHIHEGIEVLGKIAMSNVAKIGRKQGLEPRP